jgi:hypothetical protein
MNPALTPSWQTMRLGGILIDRQLISHAAKDLLRMFGVLEWTLILVLVLGTTKTETCIFIMCRKAVQGRIG